MNLFNFHLRKLNLIHIKNKEYESHGALTVLESKPKQTSITCKTKE